MKRLLAAVVAAVPLLAAIPAPAQAAEVSPSIEILTERAIAQGSPYRTYLPGAGSDQRVQLLKATFPLDVEVVCPAGTEGYLKVPQPSHWRGGIDFVCTGEPQLVSVPTAAGGPRPGRYQVEVTATLYAVGASPVSDTEVVTVTLIGKNG